MRNWLIKKLGGYTQKEVTQITHDEHKFIGTMIWQLGSKYEVFGCSVRHRYRQVLERTRFKAREKEMLLESLGRKLEEVDRRVIYDKYQWKR